MSPLSVAPLVSLTGFGLYEFGFPLLSKCVEIGLPQLILLVIFSQYIPHLMSGEKHIFDRFAVIFSVIIVWIYAHLLTVGGAYKHSSRTPQMSCRTDRAGIIGAAPWIRVPYPFQWGAPTFDAGEAFAMMAASFVALVESTGAFIAVSRIKEWGFEKGWGDTTERVRETMRIVAEILQAPDPVNIELLFQRLPVIFNIAVLSIHGYFGQSDVLGLPDTGGQVVYILDQVRALEEELLLRIKQQGLSIKPQIIVLQIASRHYIALVSGTWHVHG